MRVLIVDDSMIMRRVVIDTLRTFSDAEVVEAATGEEALDVLVGPGGPEIDLVLLDWYLPGISGLEVLDRMQADPALASVPVVMVTAERAKASVIAALRAGARNYIVKPFGREVFAKKVGPLLESKPAEAPAPTGRLTGNLSQTSPLEVIQLISLTRKTGVLVFEGSGGRGRYSLFFKDGQLDHAEGEGFEGEQAVVAATGLSDGVFTFQTEAPEHPVTIRRSTDMVMLDAFRTHSAEADASAAKAGQATRAG